MARSVNKLDAYVEAGQKRIFAGAIDWPGWCRSARSEEAALLSTSIQQAFVALRTGQPTQLPPPVANYADSLPLQARAILKSVLTCSAIVDRETVRRGVEEFVDRTNADELIVTSQVYDIKARLRSYEILAEAVLGSSPD